MALEQLGAQGRSGVSAFRLTDRLGPPPRPAGCRARPRNTWRPASVGMSITSPPARNLPWSKAGGRSAWASSQSRMRRVNPRPFHDQHQHEARESKNTEDRRDRSRESPPSCPNADGQGVGAGH